MKEIKDRLFVHPTPELFKKLRKWSLYMGGVVGSFSGIIMVNFPTSKLGVITATISGILVTVIPVICTLPNDNSNSNQNV